MGLTSTSMAAGVNVTLENQRFKSGANVVSRKILIIGTYDPSLTDIVADEPVRVFSPEHAGALTGFGFMLHRMAVQAFAGSDGVETYIVPQDEAGTAVQASGTVLFAGTATKSGTIAIYLAYSRVSVSVASGATAAEVATAISAAVNADKTLSVTASASTATVTFTAKSAGPWGNDITIAFSLKAGELIPDGITATVTAMSGGAGVPDISTALDALGTGDGSNEDFFTDVVHGYGQDTSTLDALSTYNEACYGGLVARQFRAMTGDTVAGSAGLSALTTLGGNRKAERTNGVVPVPGSASHPAEIAAQVVGIMAKINSDRAEGHCLDQTLVDIHPGDKADRWTSEYDNRDIAVKAGISTTMVKSGVVKIQNLLTFYHPDDVPITSNGYRSMRNISILQNINANHKANFEREKWQGITIVSDVNRVTDVTSRKKARDVDSVKDDLAALANAYAGKAWLYSADYTLAGLAEADSVVIRAGGTGFDTTLKLILSGEGGIFDNTVAFDTDISVAL